MEAEYLTQSEEALESIESGLQDEPNQEEYEMLEEKRRVLLELKRRGNDLKPDGMNGGQE